MNQNKWYGLLQPEKAEYPWDELIDWLNEASWLMELQYATRAVAGKGMMDRNRSGGCGGN